MNWRRRNLVRRRIADLLTWFDLGPETESPYCGQGRGYGRSPLAACLAYVDLNPIRARMASTPEDSGHTSVKKRIDALKTPSAQPKALADFVGDPREPMPTGLPFCLSDYLELVDWTGRILREDKRGAIDDALPPILERLDIEPKQWLYLTTHFESRFKTFVGSAYALKRAATALGYRRTPGLSNCRAAFR